MQGVGSSSFTWKGEREPSIKSLNTLNFSLPHILQISVTSLPFILYTEIYANKLSEQVRYFLFIVDFIFKLGCKVLYIE